MRNRPLLSVLLVAILALLLGLLLGLRQSTPAQAQVSEGRAGDIIAVASTVAGGSLLYLVDTNREVVLVYGYQDFGPTGTHWDLRNGAFEFLAGRLYRWDALLSTKREYSIKTGWTRRGLPAFGPRSSEEEYKRIEK
jgi:hypothetical protein